MIKVAKSISQMTLRKDENDESEKFFRGRKHFIGFKFQDFELEIR